MSFGSELSKVGELVTETKTSSEVNNTDVSFDPDKRLDIAEGVDFDGLDGSIDLNSETFDPDKRIDVNNDGRPDSIQDAPFNPDRRNKETPVTETKPTNAIEERTNPLAERTDLSEKADDKGVASEVKGESLEDVTRDYISDLREKSECPDTISDDAIDISDLKKISPEQRALMREEFDDNKAALRKEWEIQNNREWPKYTQDVYNKNGVLIRKAGNYYDAHHIRPLELGGKNTASNITPLDLSKHADVHSSGGSCTRLVEKVVGGAA